MATTAEGAPRRSSIEKKPMAMFDEDNAPASAFERLPPEVIQQILQATDANGFASLALLNSKWRSVAQQAHLYACHLSNCPSYATSHYHSLPIAATEENLPKLRQLFAREVKRNLFEAYLRPNKTIIKIISNSISSSSCPGGEGIQFSPSPKGHHVLAYNSSRIYVIDVHKPEIEVKRELKILRRPAATCINDNGSLLAVLLTEMQVDVYDLNETPPKRSQSIILDHSPRAIALSPCGSVLAAAYEGGIEVSSLHPGALPTERRAVKCDGVDALAFSFDGTQILGTTVHSSPPNTVILSAPYYDPGSHIAEDNISALWTTSILFPNTSRDCSHAVLIQNGKHEEASWTFTFDRSFETFRAVRIDDLRNGTTYFTGPIPSPASQAAAKLIPCTLPAASYHGELVSAGFQGKDIWLYGIPEDLDAVPETSNPGSDSGGSASSGLGRRNSGRTGSRMQESNDPTRVPQWQALYDKLRNTFVGGCKIAELEGVNTVKWVADFMDSSVKERLVVAARGVTPGMSITDDEGIDFVDGGRVTLVDFDYGIEDGTTTELTIEVGTKEPEVLEEEHRDMDAEVAIVRRRTVAQKRGSRSAVMRAATVTTSRPPPLPTAQSSARDEDDEDDPLLPRRIGALPRRVEEPAISEETETQSIIEEQEALDAPYSHASPRSGTTLRRAATAAAANRRLHPPTPAAGPVEYRRADGRAEHPHESDADNWVPPPPPYQKDDPGDMPDFLRATMPPVTVPPVPPLPNQPQLQQRQQRQQQAAEHPTREPPAPPQQMPPRSHTAAPVQRSSLAPPVAPPPPIPNQGLQGPSHGRVGSTSTLQSNAGSGPRPASRDSRYLDGENVYDVSPPDSPRRAPAEPVAPGRPSGSRTVSGSSTNSGQRNMAAPVSPPTSIERPLPAVPRIQTAPQFTLDLHIPSPTLGNIMPPSAGPSGSTPIVRRLSNSQTWPRAPKPNPAPAMAAGYPYSAPPTNLSADQALARSLPPAPSADQLASLNNRSNAAPRRLSGGFQLQRVPVGSRTSDEYTSRHSYQRPLSQQHHQYPNHQPDPQKQGYTYTPPIQTHQPQPPRPQEMNTVQQPPQEDMPLIISTPKGVSGAFDPPDRRLSGRRADAEILAPVPRHPQTARSTVLDRPTVERLETIYSVASSNGGQPVGGSLGIPLGGAMSTSQASSNARVSSLNTKQSRAERSAAKNIADAKRRGWSGRSRSKNKKKDKKKKKERDLDAASSAAWTDVTTHSTRSRRSNIFGRRGSNHNYNSGGEDDDDDAAAAGQQKQTKGNRKCVMM
ncbi:hypothetical protein QBC46DRAFT_311439 [Diplogelasinospora grovesii]|uniref:F-box domain-containing protein n=1 Tax=Diplogelasinospora grovesii TaxID=303347 RepID=A0AAN6NB77_9PEZI|nr:hypothetical protein QBC46DRAFT_311439 [Diplogelasinospora grovesii]